MSRKYFTGMLVLLRETLETGSGGRSEVQKKCSLFRSGVKVNVCGALRCNGWSLLDGAYPKPLIELSVMHAGCSHPCCLVAQEQGVKTGDIVMDSLLICKLEWHLFILPRWFMEGRSLGSEIAA